MNRITTTTTAPAKATRLLLTTLGFACLAAIGLHYGHAGAAEPAVSVPAPAQDEPAGGRHSETAVFAGGCFWGVQGVFQHVKGVTNAVSGYSGGAKGTAHYEEVGSGVTGHAESVQVTFDPTQVSYGPLLQVYFSVAHNPTELNFQGPDHGPQYRSARVPAGRRAAQGRHGLHRAARCGQGVPQPIVTRVEAFKGFFPAEGYHQNYLTLNPDNPYIAYNDLPKVADLKKMFPDRYADKPVLVPKVVASK